MKKYATVFWSGYSWTWVDASPQGPQLGERERCKLSDRDLSLDDAIRDAHAAGYCIRDVNKTSGLHSVPGPQPLQPKEGNESEK